MPSRSMPSRNAIGITAIVVAALGALTQWFVSGPLGADAGGNGLRMGLVLGLFWLAYDDLRRLPKWLLPALAVLVLAMWKFKWLLLAVPVVAAAGWLLYPRERLGRNRSSDRSKRDDTADTSARTSHR
jgi:hypothetical protein